VYIQGARLEGAPKHTTAILRDQIERALLNGEEKNEYTEMLVYIGSRGEANMR
jgi:hypothetical protein